jgi:hypothetical protein
MKKEHPFKIIDVKKDGNCFFRALAVCLGDTEDNY